MQIDLLRPTLPTTHGSANWPSKIELLRAGIIKQKDGQSRGPILGCVTPSEVGGLDSHTLRGPEEGNLISIASTGAGKTAGLIIPNVVDGAGSSLIIDIEGQIYERTAGWLHAQGHNIHNFSPFERMGCSCWNPIREINEGTSKTPNDPVRQERVRLFASLAAPVDPQAKEPYWDNAARTYLRGVVMHVSTAKLAEKSQKEPWLVRERTMAEVRRLISLPPDLFAELLNTMQASKERMVQECANTFLQMANAREQTASVKTILLEKTTLWSDERVQQATAESDFSFKELRASHARKGRPTTIYINVPFRMVEEYHALLRVMIGFCVTQLQEVGKSASEMPVTLYLDEFPQLKRMEILESGVAYLRHFGVKCWFFAQSLADLKDNYERTWQRFISNCSVRMFFGVSDYATAKLVSDMTGQTTVKTRSYTGTLSDSSTKGDSTSTTKASSWNNSLAGLTVSSSWGGSRSRADSRSTSSTRGASFGSTRSYTGRPLLMPDEVMRMPEGQMIAFFRGKRPVKGWLNYWFDVFPERGHVPAPGSVRDKQDP